MSNSAVPRAKPATATAEVLPTHSPALFRVAVARAAALLRAGELVAVPTETVYGLAANALDAVAVSRIFSVKVRPPDNPIIVHVASAAMARRCVARWPAAAERLARAFWPGPLTLVLPKAPEIPGIVTAGGSTVAVRWPRHPFVRALIQECGFPLAAPSANVSGCLSPTTADHVLAALGDRIALIVDGGPCPIGVESTVVDLTSVPARVLRPGMIHAEALRAVLGEIAAAEVEASPGPRRSPGQLARHYAPRARLLVLRWENDAQLKRELLSRGFACSQCFVVAHSRIPAESGYGQVSVMPHDPEAFARALYAELHRCDAQGADAIAVEAVPDSPEWAAIADRLGRAASA